MFDTLSNSFRSAINKIRFQDDEKALKKALDELKKALLKADVHFKVTKELIRKTEAQTKQLGIGKNTFLESLQGALKDILGESHQGFVFAPKPPTVVLMVGLQGSGKTTTTAKLAFYLKSRNKRVLVAACDLQRLAAVKQLQVLAQNAEVDFFSLEDSNASALDVANAALKKAQDELYDVLLVDTAGRLAIDEALMNELKGIKNSLQPTEVIYVADSLSGQDGIRSAKAFYDSIGVTSVILSKFDGDSKGGVALGVAYELGIPLRFVGNGEKLPDLEPFIPERVIKRLMGAGDIETLMEKTAVVMDDEKIKKFTQKIKKGNFNFTDFINQLDSFQKIGSMNSLMSLMPGMGKMASALKNFDFDNSEHIKNMRAIVNSMTPKERENPDLLNGSRRKRIADGAGLSITEVNRSIKQFENAAKMTKKLTNNKRGLEGIMGQLQIPGLKN